MNEQETSPLPYWDYISNIERPYFNQLYLACGANQSQMARVSKLSRHQLRMKLKKHGLLVSVSNETIDAAMEGKK